MAADCEQTNRNVDDQSAALRGLSSEWADRYNLPD